MPYQLKILHNHQNHFRVPFKEKCSSLNFMFGVLFLLIFIDIFDTDALCVCINVSVNKLRYNLRRQERPRLDERSAVADCLRN